MSFCSITFANATLLTWLFQRFQALAKLQSPLSSWCGNERSCLSSAVDLTAAFRGQPRAADSRAGPRVLLQPEHPSPLTAHWRWRRPSLVSTLGWGLHSLLAFYSHTALLVTLRQHCSPHGMLMQSDTGVQLFCGCSVTIEMRGDSPLYGDVGEEKAVLFVVPCVCAIVSCLQRWALHFYSQKQK